MKQENDNLSNKDLKELMDVIESVKFTSKENIISLYIILITIFIHLVFTMAEHLVP